ncbi:RHS repeat-associated core domain-containing protein [Desulfonema magnum]|uniref:RHS repeat-associated core domain-containing protein n=2 Tax=Desulfonema magnum TaxID=45655 RepID=A0A975BF41_9BACT|nr:RHS repeat-associated core domain-containing protein [Desulfonema magnum]QTA84143.1 RHS repeat-associated core domain-containing protein [Desulfonema magnum]
MHDPLGRRIPKKVNGALTEKYLWQGLTRLLAVYNADDTLKMRFEYADARMPAAMTSGDETYYLAYDQVGTLKVVADSSGTVVKKIEYDTFGNIISDSDPAFAVPFGFAGGLHDKDTGLVRFGYRDYDPETGKWTAKDPIFFEGGDTDLYGYCVNDPVNWTDSDGLSKTKGIKQGKDEYYQKFKDTKGDQNKIRELEEEICKKREDGKIKNKRWNILKALIKIAKDGRLFKNTNLLLMFEWQIRLLENPCLLNNPDLPVDEFGVPSS